MLNNNDIIEIKKILNMLDNTSYKNAFITIIMFELNYNIDKITISKIHKILKVYNIFMENDYYTSIINEDIKEIINQIEN